MFLVAVATLVPVLIAFCVMPARAATTGVGCDVAARPRFTTLVFAVARVPVRAPTAARADVAVCGAVVADWPRDGARPVGRVAHSASPKNPIINTENIAIFFIFFPLQFFYILSYLAG